MRTSIPPSVSAIELAVIMSEGNPGALSVLIAIIHKDPVKGMFDILHLDDMNIRGPQIWIGYKDHCGQDLDRFLKALRERDAEMISKINKNHPEELAVEGGASFERPGF